MTLSQDAVTTAVHALETAGLYARASAPVDWENARRQGKPPNVLRGGTHVEKTPDLNVVHGSYMITFYDDAQEFEVQGTNHPPVRFNDLPGAVKHITRFWKPVPSSTPIRRG